MVQLAVLVPVLARPQNAARLAESLRLNTVTEHRLIWICSPGDDEEIAACEATYGEVMVVPWQPGRADWAMKINYAFTHTDEPWLFQAGDDLRFHRGWDTSALLAAQRFGKGVVGTNDLGNMLVIRGSHSTHTLFSRAYIEAFGGGTVDGSGLVFSTAYDHQWSDNEFIDTAKARGQFVASKRSIVEHLHPHWGKAEMDPTYEKATRETAKDRQLYSIRVRALRAPDIRRQRLRDKREARAAARKAARSDI